MKIFGKILSAVFLLPLRVLLAMLSIAILLVMSGLILISMAILYPISFLWDIIGD
jgi:hypothetical protein